MPSFASRRSTPPSSASSQPGSSTSTRRPGLLGLLIFFTVFNLLVGVIQVLFTPLVLSFASVETLGFVLSVAGLGMLAGSMSF